MRSRVHSTAALVAIGVAVASGAVAKVAGSAPTDANR